MDGRAVRLTGRQRALLAGLLLDAGRVVSVERLAGRLWGEDLPPSAAARVRALIAELRRALGAAEVIVTRSPGYLVPAGAVDVDADEFAALVATARREAGDGLHAEAITTYDRALELWRGDPYPDLGGPVAEAERHRLDELRTEAIEGRADAQLAVGRHQAVIAGLARVVAEQPLRERPHGLLMLALHRGGRLPEALRVYREFRDRLVRELGVEPGRDLQSLHQSILEEDPAARLAPVPRQLPPDTGRFVGREAELPRMDAGRVTLLVGPAGCREDRAGAPLGAPAGRALPGRAALPRPAGLRPARADAAVGGAAAAAAGARPGGEGHPGRAGRADRAVPLAARGLARAAGAGRRRRAGPDPPAAAG
ncbi:BTAD domain-containing putative transcriptional regulator [Nonomuraea ferruginea]